MSYSHVKVEPVAKAEAIPLGAEEDSDVREPRLFELYLDSDAKYRWYEEDEPTDAYGETLLDAIAAAEDSWDGFQLVELRGEPVEPDTDIEDTYAADEIDELGGLDEEDYDYEDEEELDDFDED